MQDEQINLVALAWFGRGDYTERLGGGSRGSCMRK
jgi:hypothetical protein